MTANHGVFHCCGRTFTSEKERKKHLANPMHGAYQRFVKFSSDNMNPVHKSIDQPVARKAEPIKVQTKVISPIIPYENSAAVNRKLRSPLKLSIKNSSLTLLHKMREGSIKKEIEYQFGVKINIPQRNID
jgi:hypothetical protein